MDKDANLTMTFTVHEWRLLAIAAVRVKKAVFIDGDRCRSQLADVATRILNETGK